MTFRNVARRGYSILFPKDKLYDIIAGPLTITPTEGANLLTDPGFEAWSSATNLTNWSEVLAGATTVNQETSVIHGGSNAARVSIDGSNSGFGIAQAFAGGTGVWKKWRVWARVNSGASRQFQTFVGATGSSVVTLTTSYAQYTGSFISITNSDLAFYRAGPDTSALLYFDDAEYFNITDILQLYEHSVPYAEFSANITNQTNTQSGIVFNANAETSPTEYTNVWISGTGRIYIDRVNAGVRTNINNYAVTYVAGAKLLITRYEDGTIDITYNNVSVATGITSTGLTGLFYGIFSTHSANSFTLLTADSRTIP